MNKKAQGKAIVYVLLVVAVIVLGVLIGRYIIGNKEYVCEANAEKIECKYNDECIPLNFPCVDESNRGIQLWLNENYTLFIGRHSTYDSACKKHKNEWYDCEDFDGFGEY